MFATEVDAQRFIDEALVKNGVIEAQAKLRNKALYLEARLKKDLSPSLDNRI